MSLLEEKVDETLEIEAQVRGIELVEEDDENMESAWHRLAMNLLIEVVSYFLRARSDYFVGGNMFIYFNEEVARHRNFRGPDFFFVWGVPLEPLRRYWMTWQEGGRYPDVIIELLSPRTAKEDKGSKKDVYEKVFHTHEYFWYDPDTHVLQGWRLINHHYEPLQPNDRGWLWCEELDLWLGTWEGKFQDRQALWLRFYDRDGKVVATFAEASQQQLEASQQQLEASQQQLEASQQQLEASQQQLQEESQRLEAAEAEVARLKVQLAQQSKSSGGKEETPPT